MNQNHRSNLGPDGNLFCWGKILKVHEVGKYQIVEYEPSQRRGVASIAPFHVFVDGRDTNSAATSLELALLAAIAHGARCPEAALFAARVLNLKV